MAAAGGEQVEELSSGPGLGSRAPPTQPLKLQMKKTYKPISKLEVFYTGGRVGVSRDGSFVACPCGEEVKVVDIASGAVRVTLAGDSEAVTAVAVSPDNVSVFYSSRSLQTKWWTIDPLECRRSWKAHDGPVSDMAVDSSGGLLATGSADRTIRVWDIERGYCTHSFRGHDGVVSRVMFHPDTHRLQLISGGDDAAVCVWDLVTKTCVACFKKHFSRVTDLSISADGWLLLSASRDKVVNVWDLRDNMLCHTVPVFEALEAVAVVLEGSGLPGVGTATLTSTTKQKLKRIVDQPLHFLTAGENGLLKIWKADSATCVFQQKREERDGMGLATEKATKEEHQAISAADNFTGAMIMPDGRTILGVTGDQRLVFYRPKAETAEGDHATDNEARKQSLEMNKQLIGNNDDITDLKFIGKELDLLAVATNTEQIRIYNMETSTCVRSLVGHSDIVLCLDACVSTTGRPLLVSAGKDHNARVWDVETGACVAVAAGHIEAVSAIALSRKRHDFIVTGGSDRTIKVWSLEGIFDQWKSGQEPVKLKSKAVVAAHDKDINAVAISPNDAVACTGSQDRTARLWNLPNLTPNLTLRGHKRGVWCVEFSPIDRVVATASGDKTIRIWSLETGMCLKTFEGHTASVLRVSFLTRGTQLISSGADGLVKLWTIRSNECVNTFDHHNDKVWALAVSSKQEMLATGGSDALVNLWVDFTAAEEEEAERQAEEDLLKDQDLSNALSSGEYARAIELGFELKRPQKLLYAFGEVMRTSKSREILHEVVCKFDKLRLRQCLEYVREWNTNSRYCHLAQCVLHSILEAHPMKEVIEVPALQELLAGLIPYSTRHFKRMDRLVRSTFLLDYTLSCMSVLFPASDGDMNSIDVTDGFLSQKSRKVHVADRVLSTVSLRVDSTEQKLNGLPDANMDMSRNEAIVGMTKGWLEPSGGYGQNGAAEDRADAVDGDGAGEEAVGHDANCISQGDNRVATTVTEKRTESRKKAAAKVRKKKSQSKVDTAGEGHMVAAVQSVFAGVQETVPSNNVRSMPADDVECETGTVVANVEQTSGEDDKKGQRTKKRKGDGSAGEKGSAGISEGAPEAIQSNGDRVRALLQGLDLEIELSEKRKARAKGSIGHSQMDSNKKMKVVAR